MRFWRNWKIQPARTWQKDLPRLRGNYLGMLRLIDDQTKRLIEGFKAAGLYENTIFVILSDHGDYCGEYGLIRKRCRSA